MGQDSFELLRGLAMGLSGAVTAEDVIGVVAVQAARPIGACAGFVGLVTPDGQQLEILRALGAHEQSLPPCRFPVTASVPTAEAVRTGGAVFLEDVEARTARYPAWREGRWAGYGAWAAFPLVAHGQTLGAMLLCFAEPTHFDQPLTELIATVSELCAQAIHRALLLEDEQRARARAEQAEQRLGIIADASRILSSSLDYRTTLQAVAQLPIPSQAAWCAIALLEDGVLRRVAEAGERSLAREGTVTVQIAAHGERLGELAWARARPSRAADQALVEEVARRIGSAVANARAYTAAREADRRKDEFLAMLGHELRNPLAPIFTALELLKLRERPDRELEVIGRHVTHVARLVDDLMDVSRITRGKVELQKAPVDARALITRALEMASPLFEKRAQHVAVEGADRPVVIDGDETRLAQVLANLFTNAARYTPPGGHIRVALATGEGRASISVRDDGIGISAALLPHIFDSFVQGPRTTDRGEGGLGIGLSLVKNLVELHGGAVEARSEGEGRGSEFVVTLPVAASAVKVVPVRATSAPRPLRVLVVDDNADAADLLRDLLRGVGHTVATAYDGVEALRVAGEHKPEVALLDLGLPVMDGYELALRLRQLEPSPRLIAISGYGQAADRVRSQRAGFESHLTKPVTGDDLIRALDAPAESTRARG